MISTDILHAGSFQIKFPNISRYTWIFAKIKESTQQNKQNKHQLKHFTMRKSYRIMLAPAYSLILVDYISSNLHSPHSHR